MTDDEALLMVAPELAAVDPARREFFLGVMRPEVRTSLGQYAYVLATAHELTLDARGASGTAAVSGPVSSETEGQLSRSYAQAKLSGGWDAYWNSTPYGTRFWALVQAHTVMPLNRMV